VCLLCAETIIQAAPYDSVGDVRDEFQTTYTALPTAAAGHQLAGGPVSSMTLSATGQVRTRSVRRSNPNAGLPADAASAYDTIEQTGGTTEAGGRIISLDQPYEVEVGCKEASRDAQAYARLATLHDDFASVCAPVSASQTVRPHTTARDYACTS